MDWKSIISDLNETGLTQVQIAELCGVAQATVSDLHRGTTKRPGYEFADRLRQLHGNRIPGSAYVPTEPAAAGG